MIKKKKNTISERTEEQIVKKGISRDGEMEENNSAPSTIRKGERRIGCSKGATVPTVAYGNIKISVWEERVVNDDDREARKVLNEISEYLDNWLQSEVDEVMRGISK